MYEVILLVKALKTKCRIWNLEASLKMNVPEFCRTEGSIFDESVFSTAPIYCTVL